MHNRNNFTNINVENWFRWLLRTKDNLNGIGVYFLSKRYSTSPRNFPLYNNSKNIRIILFKGSIIPGVDRLILKFLGLFIKFAAKKFKMYRYNFVFTPRVSSKKYCNEILNFDDPEYNNIEIKEILNWEKCLNSKGFTSKIVCTTNYTKKYLINNGSMSRITIIPQGHSSDSTLEKVLNKRNDLIRLVYASPYIDIEGDLHQNHVNWNASNLIDIIWEKLKTYDNLQLHLIGKVGDNAKRKLLNSNVVLHGLVPISKCSEILRTCDIALYPRTYDNKRQAQKVIEYIGAGLPTVGFNTLDCKILEEVRAGILVNSTDDFVKAVLELSQNIDLLNELKNNCYEMSQRFDWSNLAKALDDLVNDSI
jgi:glycosyltransferase involved in cell wall biosynthesis